MYNRNYSELALWLDGNLSDALIGQASLKSYEIINCKHGWVFDKSVYPATVISEV
jgi:hypothetical protein